MKAGKVWRMESSSWNCPLAIFRPRFLWKKLNDVIVLLFMPDLIHYYFWIKHPEDIKVYLVWGLEPLFLSLRRARNFPDPKL
jgi:hypothetical protein